MVGERSVSRIQVLWLKSTTIYGRDIHEKVGFPWILSEEFRYLQDLGDLKLEHLDLVW